MHQLYYFIHRLVLFFIFLTPTVGTQAAFNPDSLREGDLVFVCENKNNAITKVTCGIHDATIDHVGIVIWKDRQWEVLEAIHRGVVLTSLDQLISRHTFSGTNSSILYGRVTGDVDIPASIRRAMSYLGRPYDFYFMPDDKEIYCSELVQKSYVDHSGHLIFHSIPMSFHNHKGHILHYWKRYYQKAGMTVPEGMPGSNPGDLSRNKRVIIL